MSKWAKEFHFRSFISLLLFLSFLFSAFSGLVLFLRPEGSLANWFGWSVMGLDKKQWEGVHAVLVLFFFITAIVHLLYNRKVLAANLWRKKTWFVGMFRGMGLSGEFFTALFLIALIFTGTLLRWPPFSSVAKLRSAIKDGKYFKVISPPVADTDQLTVAKFCALFGISEQRILSNAAANGIQIGSLSETLDAIAIKNRLTPEKVFLLLKGN